MEHKDGYERICVWPDGTWCNINNVEEYAHMSDDYAIVRVPEEFIRDDDFEDDLQEVIKRTISFNKESATVLIVL